MSNKTEKKGLVTSRVGQGYYRQQILEKWNYTSSFVDDARLRDVNTN